MLEDVRGYLTENSDRFKDELKTFLSIPSVSADSSRSAEMKQAAEFVFNQLSESGLEAEIVQTAGHPIVYGEWTQAESAPTILVYGHYDVQPPDPLDLWVTPPFEPDERDGYVYARGATDDKGQMFTHVKAVEGWMKTAGKLPINVKFLIEGEEEVGSNNLDIFLSENKERLACDVAVISDTSQYAPGIPAITYGLRGILACEITLTGPNRDLHSGVFGGSVANPANALAKMVGSLLDEDGRVQIPGFYDDVIPLSEEERQQFADLPFDESAFCADLDIDSGWGEVGFTATERRWARPTCDVNGFHSGYAGEGPKTIVPSYATVKITCRLVPGQDPVKLTQALHDYLKAQCPAGVQFDFKDYHGCEALVFDFQSPYMEAARSAIEQSFGRTPVMIREGGSIPVVASFQEILSVDTLLLGWGQNSDNLHSPNERFSLEDFGRGTHASAILLNELAKQAT